MSNDDVIRLRLQSVQDLISALMQSKNIEELTELHGLAEDNLLSLYYALRPKVEHSIIPKYEPV